MEPILIDSLLMDSLNSKNLDELLKIKCSLISFDERIDFEIEEKIRIQKSEFDCVFNARLKYLKEKDKNFDLQKLLDYFSCTDVNDLTVSQYEKLTKILSIKVIHHKFKVRNENFDFMRMFDYFICEIMLFLNSKELDIIGQLMFFKFDNFYKKTKKEF